MLELNYWFFVQLFNFLALLIFLNFFLFKPVLSLLQGRTRMISDKLEKAREIQRKSEEAMAKLNQEITTAKKRGRHIFLEFQREGFNEQRRTLEKAKEKAAETIGKANGEIRKDTEKARALLKEEVYYLSSEITKKILGREL
ncbi:MAG: ATP synthase F0 subunit B [Nitrospirae bacterium]|nr:ATP synthase F0 subunit B [Nitrospirota bacterium]